MRFPAAVAGSCALLLIGAGSASACTSLSSLLRTSDALNKTTFAGTTVGGLSALDQDAPGHAVALVDNDGSTAARVYDLRLRSDASDGIDVGVTGVTTLAGFTGDDFDGEGLAVEPDGSLLASSETDSTIRHFARDGSLLGALDVPARFRASPMGQATSNSTLEGLSLSPSGTRLVSAMEGALSSDPPTTDGRPRLRMLVYTRGPGGAFGSPRQVAYEAEPGQGISDVLMLDDSTALVLERSLQVDASFAVRVFVAKLSGASDVTDVDSLSTSGVVPATKRLLFDLRACPGGLAALDNVEGMTLGPDLADGRRLLYLVSDDNFSALQHTRVYEVAFRLVAPPSAPTPTTPSVPTTAAPAPTTTAPVQTVTAPTTAQGSPATTPAAPTTAVTATAPVLIVPPPTTPAVAQQPPPVLPVVAVLTPLTIRPTIAKRRLRDALRRGLPVRPGCSLTCSASVALSLRGRRVATATSSRIAPGGTLTARFGPRTRARLADHKRLSFTVAVRASAGGRTVARRATIAVRR